MKLVKNSIIGVLMVSIVFMGIVIYKQDQELKSTINQLDNISNELVEYKGVHTNTIADGNVTKEESELMQKEWCEYNKGRDFAKEQCEDI